MKFHFLILLLTLFVSLGLAHGEITEEKRQEITKLFRLMGQDKALVQMVSVMLTNMKADMPQIPADFWPNFQQKVNPQDLVQKLVPIYDKYFTLEDLKAINAFYESPVGQKMVGTMPQVMQESMQAGQDWSTAISKQATEEAAAAPKK